MEIQITSINLVGRRTSMRTGLRDIAQFNCDIGRLVRLKGCRLMRTDTNGLTVWLPTFHDEKGVVLKSVAIIDDSLRHRLMEAARNAYRALGGTEAEWVPHAD